MNISKIPSDYQAACTQLTYTITNVYSDMPIEVNVYDSAQQDIVGIKRFRGATSYEVNVANYVQQQFEIAPIVHPSCAIVADTTRLVGVTIQVNNEVISQRTWHTFGVLDAIAKQKLSNSPKIKKIAAKECDEISFVAPQAQISAMVLISGQEKNYSFALPQLTADKNVHSMILKMDDLEQKIRQNGYVLEDFSEITVTICADGVEFINQNYIIVPQRKSSVQLCWLNRFGTIDYYTFIGCSERTATVENIKVYAEQGYKSVGATTQFKSTIISEYEPQQCLVWLSEIIASPQVWTVDGDTYTPISVKSQSVRVHSAKLSRMEISVSPIKNQFSQKN